MTYAANPKRASAYEGYDRPVRETAVSHFGILRRAFGAFCHALHESRRRQAMREIANLDFLQGRPMSDDLERNMTRRMFRSDWSPRG
jgi:hypothetical protein